MTHETLEITARLRSADVTAFRDPMAFTGEIGTSDLNSPISTKEAVTDEKSLNGHLSQQSLLEHVYTNVTDRADHSRLQRLSKNAVHRQMVTLFTRI